MVKEEPSLVGRTREEGEEESHACLPTRMLVDPHESQVTISMALMVTYDLRGFINWRERHANYYLGRERYANCYLRTLNSAGCKGGSGAGGAHAGGGRGGEPCVFTNKHVGKS